MKSRASISISVKTWISAAATRFALFCVGWLILTQGKLSDITFVVLLLAGTTAISLWTIPPRDWRLRPAGLICFAPCFLRTALRGGVDVARRVVPARMPIDPAFITVTVDVSEKQKMLLILVVSLLPGTAVCGIEGNRLVVHCLDQSLPVEAGIRDLCSRIKRVVA